MIDWMSLKLPCEKISPEIHNACIKHVDRIITFSPDGEIVNSTFKWTSLRSDTQGVTIHYTPNQLVICGSPASVNQTNNVFGTDCVKQAFNIMLDGFERHINVSLPRWLPSWSLTRLDSTQNYFLGSIENVHQALKFLAYGTTRGENVERRHTTTYWSKNSDLRSGKAYAKGEHAKRIQKKYSSSYTDEQIQMLQGVLRLELKLGNRFFRRMRDQEAKGWWTMTPDNVITLNKNYFKQLTSDVKITSKTEAVNNIEQVTETDGQFKAALSLFSLITQLGYTEAKAVTNKATWYRNIKFLKDAGLTTADLRAGQVLSHRIVNIDLNTPVTNWQQLKEVASK